MTSTQPYSLNGGNIAQDTTAYRGRGISERPSSQLANDARINEIKEKYKKLVQRSKPVNPVPTPPTTSSQNPLNSEEARSKGDNPIDSYYQFYCNYRQKTLLESKENEKNSLHFREQGAVKRNRTVTHHQSLRKELQGDTTQIEKYGGHKEEKLTHMYMQAGDFRRVYEPRIALEPPVKCQQANLKYSNQNGPIIESLEERSSRLLKQIQNQRTTSRNRMATQEKHRENSRTFFEKKQIPALNREQGQSKSKQLYNFYPQHEPRRTIEYEVQTRIPMGQKRKREIFSAHRMHKDPQSHTVAARQRCETYTDCENQVTPQNRKIEREKSFNGGAQWFKNATSFYRPATEEVIKPAVVLEREMESKLDKFVIKRTITQEHFVNMSRLNMISAFNPETDKTNLEQTMIAANRVDNTQQEQKRRSELEERTKYHERAYRNECPGGSKGTPVGSKSFNMSKEQIKQEQRMIPETNMKESQPKCSVFAVKPMYSQTTLPTHIIDQEKMRKKDFKINLVPIPMGDQVIDRTQVMKKQMFKKEHEHRGEQYYERTQVGQSSKPAMKQFVGVLCQQITLDEKLRNLKIWFSSYKNSHKWQDLQVKMQARRRELTIEQLKEEFREVDTESNPFFDEKPINVTIDNLVNAYLDSCEHWNRYVVGQFSKQMLIADGITANRIDLQRKGYILIEDMVRFLSIQSGIFMRTRDVALIFKRFERRSCRIRFDSLVQVLTSNR